MYKKFCILRLNTEGLNVFLNRNIKTCFEDSNIKLQIFLLALLGR